MNIIIEEAGFKLVDLKTLKAHLRIENDVEDEYLEKIIDMSSDILEAKIGKTIAKKRYRHLYIDDEAVALKKIYLPAQPAIEICSVKEMPPNSSDNELSFSKGTDRKSSYVTIRGSKYPVKIEYYAGVADSREKVPKAVQYAVLKIAESVYEHLAEDPTKFCLVEYALNSYMDVSLS